MSRRDTLLAVFVATAWGINFVIVALILERWPPLLATAVRFFLVAIPAIFFVPRPARWGPMILVGFFIGGVQFGLLFTAMSLGMNAGLASLVIQLVTIFTVLLAVVVLQEVPTRLQVVGVVVGLCGLAVVAVGRDASASLIPFAMVIVAALGWAAANITMRKSGEPSGFSMTVWSATVMPIPMLIASLIVEGPQTVANAVTDIDLELIALLLFNSGVASLIGFGIWMSLLRRYPAAVVAPWSLLTPPVGMLSAWLVLHQTFTPVELVGAAIVLLGVLCASSGARRPFALQPTPNVS